MLSTSVDTSKRTCQSEMKPNLFSHEEYRSIIRQFRSRHTDFIDAITTDDFVVIRHDVEFSMNRAYDLALINHDMGISNTFLFQVRCNAYNIHSIKNTKLINEIISLNQHVGLHLYISHINEGDWKHLENELKVQADLLSSAVGFPITRFSYHRPPHWALLRRDNYICEMLNLYGESFFELNNTPTIKYLSDSNHAYKYGHPLKYKSNKRIQLLFHPDEWTDQGADEKDNFMQLEIEHSNEFKNTLNAEQKTYKKYM